MLGLLDVCVRERFMLFGGWGALPSGEESATSPSPFKASTGSCVRVSLCTHSPAQEHVYGLCTVHRDKRYARTCPDTPQAHAAARVWVARALPGLPALRDPLLGQMDVGATRARTGPWLDWLRNHVGGRGLCASSH